MNITNFNDIAEANGFIACYPTGINGAWNANMNVSISQADDLGFIEALAAHMQNNFNADPNRQYLVGMSNGGFMSYKLACESSQCFAGMVSISGVMSDTVYQNCSNPMSLDILHIHGTADGVVAYNGSPTTGISVDELTEHWQQALGCDLNPVFSPMPNPNALDLSYPERYTFTNCTNNELELIKIIGGGHQWPGILTVWGGVGTINMDFYSPQIAWDFLQGKQCSVLNSVETLDTQVEKQLVRTVDLMGRTITPRSNMPVIYMYEDGTSEIRFQITD